MEGFITPTWPQPKNVKAFTTTRYQGHSVGSYKSFNLAAHVGDDDVAVAANRELLAQKLQLPSPGYWLQQTHSNKVVTMSDAVAFDNNADASVTFAKNKVCAVLTADCLPLLVTNKQGTVAAAIHAGWRGLAANIISNTIKTINLPTADLMVWLGPAISKNSFEIGEEVRQVFLANNNDNSKAFHNVNDKLFADLYQLATIELNNLGITQVYGGDYCTYQQQQFYSYRRDNITGRMATLIWLN